MMVQGNYDCRVNMTMKSTNDIPCPSSIVFPARACSESCAPMIMFGGSPIWVAAPPMFENMTSAIISGTGSRSRTFDIWIVTGTISRIVVTLSKKAEKTVSWWCIG